MLELFPATIEMLELYYPFSFQLQPRESICCLRINADARSPFFAGFSEGIEITRTSGDTESIDRKEKGINGNDAQSAITDG